MSRSPIAVATRVVVGRWSIAALALCGAVVLASNASGTRGGAAATPATTGVPTALGCGASRSITLDVRNTTRRTWTSSKPLTLRANADAIALGSPSVVFREGAGPVEPGKVASFRVRLTAPATPTLLWPAWSLRRGAVWTKLKSSGATQVSCDTGSWLDRKVVAGYQGWFSCPDDGAPPGNWVHWFNGAVPDAEHAGFDLWPDTSDLTPGERCPTDMTLPDGSRAVLFSSANPTTVERHVGLMEEHGIDGVFYQRFLTTLDIPRLATNRDVVLRNLLRSAERHGRKVAVAWDVTGYPDAAMRSAIQRDWQHLVDDLRVTSSPAYVYDHGRPLVEVWGLGFGHVAATPSTATAIIRDFHQPPLARLRARVVGGVEPYWGNLVGEPRPDPAWADVYERFDAIHPWPLGRYWDDVSTDAYRAQSLAPDIALTRSRGQDYFAVVFPGFSWQNLWRNRGESWPLNQVPRRGGRFLWHQGVNAVEAGATTIYVAMFDEFDEGTAILNAVPTRAGLPVNGTFLALDADGEDLPADWYLRVTGEIGRMLRGEIAPEPELPIHP